MFNVCGIPIRKLYKSGLIPELADMARTWAKNWGGDLNPLVDEIRIVLIIVGYSIVCGLIASTVVLSVLTGLTKELGMVTVNFINLIFLIQGLRKNITAQFARDLQSLAILVQSYCSEISFSRFLQEVENQKYSPSTKSMTLYVLFRNVIDKLTEAEEREHTAHISTDLSIIMMVKHRDDLKQLKRLSKLFDWPVPEYEPLFENGRKTAQQKIHLEQKNLKGAGAINQ